MFFIGLATLRRFGLWAALAFAALCWGVLLWPGHNAPLIDLGVLLCAGYFFSGVALYFIFSRFAARPAYLLGISGALAATGVACLVLGLNTRGDIAISCAIILIAALFDQRLGEGGARLRSIGNISYSLYLVHVPLQMTMLLVADLFFDGTRQFAEHPLLLPAYLIASIMLATWAFVYFERPAGRYFRRLLAK